MYPTRRQLNAKGAKSSKEGTVDQSLFALFVIFAFHSLFRNARL